MGQRLYVDRARVGVHEELGTYTVCASLRFCCRFSTSETEKASFTINGNRPLPLRLNMGRERVVLYRTTRRDVARQLMWSFVLGKGYQVNYNPVFFRPDNNVEVTNLMLE